MYMHKRITPEGAYNRLCVPGHRAEYRIIVSHADVHKFAVYQWKPQILQHILIEKYLFEKVITGYGNASRTNPDIHQEDHSLG